MKIAQKQDYSQLFSGLPASKNQNNIFNSINLSDYATVKNGSYGKLLKAYYKPENTKTNSSTNTSKDSVTEKVNESKKSATTVKSDIKQLSSAFEKVASEKEAPKSEDVKSFVDSYNDALKSGKDSTSGTIKAMTSGMQSLVSRNSDEMAKIGVSVQKDGTLKFDEDKFKKVSKGEEKNNFDSSFVEDMKKYIEKIEKKAEDELNNTSTYNNKANFDAAVTGLNFDKMF